MLWNEKHTALSDLAAVLQDKCQVLGIDADAFYRAWDPHAASVAQTHSLKSAARLGTTEELASEAAVCESSSSLPVDKPSEICESRSGKTS